MVASPSRETSSRGLQPNAPLPGKPSLEVGPPHSWLALRPRSHSVPWHRGASPSPLGLLVCPVSRLLRCLHLPVSKCSGAPACYPSWFLVLSLLMVTPKLLLEAPSHQLPIPSGWRQALGSHLDLYAPPSGWQRLNQRSCSSLVAVLGHVANPGQSGGMLQCATEKTALSKACCCSGLAGDCEFALPCQTEQGWDN